MIFLKISQNFVKSPLKFTLSHRFQSNYGMYAITGIQNFVFDKNFVLIDSMTPIFVLFIIEDANQHVVS